MCLLVFEFQKPCAEPYGELGSLDLGGSLSPTPAHFQHSVCLTLKTLQNTQFLDFPLLQSGSVSQSVLQFLACLLTQLLIQKEAEKHSQGLHPEQLRGYALPGPPASQRPDSLGWQQRFRLCGKRNLTVLASSPSFLWVLLAGSH